MIRFAYLGLFSVTQASIPEVSKIVMDARAGSSFWQIGSVRSTRWSNMDCKSGKKSCLKRVNLEASGTTSNHKNAVFMRLLVFRKHLIFPHGKRSLHPTDSFSDIFHPLMYLYSLTSRIQNYNRTTDLSHALFPLCETRP